MYEGTVTNVNARGFGFIHSSGSDYFFHCKQLSSDLEFDQSLLERRVRFDLRDSPKGMECVRVRASD
jgi:cold shock CspA family protein